MQVGLIQALGLIHVFGELITLVDLLRSGTIDASAKKAALQRDESVLAMLTAYFFLKDLVDEGSALIKDAGSNPLETIRSLPESEAELKLAEWDFALKRQGFRMRQISQLIFGQEFLEIASPELRNKLDKAVGSKFDRATSLQGIGAALFFRAIFPLDKTAEDRAGYIALMAGENGELLNIERAEAEVAALRQSLEAYRLAISQLASGSEIMRLSAEARRRTDYSRRPDER